MKRINEKVKDLIEVRSCNTIDDFVSDPAQTLSAYYFTDVTADLMAKWLDKVVNIQAQNGAACALAGYRGGGKSHFLAALGAIISHPELSSRITESHVSAIAQHLKRTRYSVGYVRRGTHETCWRN
jgi:energy-coupling factor transporter ATP-binding protein EcfA2